MAPEGLEGNDLRKQGAPASPEPLLVIEAGSTPLGQYLRDLAHHSDLIRVLAARDIKLRYRQTVIGALWVVIQPLASAGVLSFVFGRIARLPTDGESAFLIAFTGMLGWNAFSQTVNRTTGSLLANSALVSKVFFPRLILPVAAVASVIVDLAVSVAMLLVILGAQGRFPDAAGLLTPVWLLLLLLLGQGLGTLFASMSVRYRDLAQISPVLLQLLLYASPVAYAVVAVPDRYVDLYYLNPLSSLLGALRWSVLGSPFPRPGPLAGAAATALVIALVGSITLEKRERGFADVI